MKILLASQSPRRKELLQTLGFDFEVVKIDCEEILPLQILPKDAAGYLSQLKAKSFRKLVDDEVLLNSDTVVCFGDEILGKPKDFEDAFRMLKMLSGKKHKVYSGITIETSQKSITETDVAEVEFDVISDDEIQYYLENFKPYDKAGSYGIQEWIGMAKVKKIEGSFYSIMGLPTHLVYKIITQLKN